MTDNKQKASSNSGISPAVVGAAAVVGAIVGAAVVELTDDKKRNAVEKAIGDKVEDFREKGEKVVDNLKKTASDTK